MRLANLEHIPLTPRGKGTGLIGGAIPIYGGIVLSCERMEKIVDIDRENLMVITEPGIITGELQKAVEAEGLFYPPDPASLASCSIGGNVAEGAGESRAVRYGTTKDYVNGLEVVLPSGEMISTGGKVVKDVTGYNLTQLITGSGELLDDEWERLIDRAQRDLYKETIDLGGKITAEHGIGLLGKPFLSMNLDPCQIELLKGLKKAFDPKNILNPGKIFDL